MVFFLFRVLLAPFAVVVGTWAQRRFGDAVGGLVIGLPLASVPLLWLVALQHGATFTTSMIRALLVGGVAEGAVMWLYAHLTSKVTPSRALAMTLLAFAFGAALVSVFNLSALVAGLLTALGFALSMRWWPVSASTSPASPGRPRLWPRALLAALLTMALATLAGRLGPVLSGLIDAVPATSLMMAFFTHQEHGADATSHFLYGVTRGSFSFLASMIVLVAMLNGGSISLAFGVSMLVAFLVQGSFQIYDFARARRVARHGSSATRPDDANVAFA
ncbi:MAG TPA: hypothetical protein VGG21_06285 [Acidimicrobiales bacterium]|jgi:hypothetical protein